ncbi:MAG: hypothetical protein ACLFPE_05045, partial [Bacteroidales bacterium]
MSHIAWVSHTSMVAGRLTDGSGRMVTTNSSVAGSWHGSSGKAEKLSTAPPDPISWSWKRQPLVEW